MINIEFENSVLTSVRHSHRRSGEVVFYITLADTSGKVVNLVVNEVPSDVGDYQLLPVRGKVHNVGFISSEKGVLNIVADRFVVEGVEAVKCEK